MRIARIEAIREYFTKRVRKYTYTYWEDVPHDVILPGAGVQLRERRRSKSEARAHAWVAGICNVMSSEAYSESLQ